MPESKRFVIHIDLTAGGGEIERYDKPRKPDKPVTIEGADNSIAWKEKFDE